MKRLVVNENDEIIGAKERDDLDFAKDIYRVSCLWVTNSKNEILVAQRGLKLNNGPGLYAPAVAGTVEEGETYESNIYKEAEEEIGLVGVTFTKGPKLRSTGNRNFFCQYFTTTIDRATDEFTPQEYEVEKLMWVPYNDLKKDVQLHPKKYVEGMGKILETFRAK